jgi:hypothetical protein
MIARQVVVATGIMRSVSRSARTSRRGMSLLLQGSSNEPIRCIQTSTRGISLYLPSHIGIIDAPVHILSIDALKNETGTAIQFDKIDVGDCDDDGG